MYDTKGDEGGKIGHEREFERQLLDVVVRYRQLCQPRQLE